MKNEREKDPNAVLLGRLGGLARTKKKRESSRRNLEKARAARLIASHSNGLPMRRTPQGAYQYEISPGKWVSRQRIHQIRHPEAHLAQHAAQKLRAQPCQKCGTLLGVERHHENYARRLEVQWLCPKHHREADKIRRKNGKK